MQSIIQTLLIFLLLTGFTSGAVSKPDDFEIIRERVVAELMKTPVEDAEVASIMGRMNADGSFNDINYDDLSRTAGFPHRRHTHDLVTLARAYRSRSSDHYRSRKVKDHIVRGLQHWVENDYFGDNWHNNQISTPTNLVNLMLLIGDELPDNLVEGAQPMIGRAHMNASGARPSGDRIVIAGILAKNLLFTGQKEKFDQIIELIEGEVKFSTGKRGMQHDYSFHHRTDRVNNTTSYGYGKYANNFGEWSYYVANTKYEFSREKINHLVDYYLDGIYKQLVYGIYEDISVKNRSITHRQSSFEPRGTVEIERLLFSTDYRKDELEEILRLRKGEAEPSQSFAKFFWQTEHFVLQRPDYYTTVRMYSTRNMNMEEPYNGPGKPTHHRADGTNYLQLKGNEYHNIWAVYDWQKISGTTIMQKPQLHPPSEIRKEGLTDFVGAVTDGMVGAVGYDFRSTHDLTRARKSWFFFDREYACLGAGIHSRPDLPVATTVNQVLMRSEVRVMQDGQERVMPEGSRELENVKWVHHDRVGYLFPEPAKVQLSNQPEQGRWSDITDQKNISTELVTRDVFMLWFDHGNSPDDASYQYIVVPAVDRQELQSGSDKNRGIRILSNTTDLQAVRSDQHELCQAAFYKAGSLEISEGQTFRMHSQGMVMLEMDGNRIRRISLADPSRKLKTLMVTLPGIYDVSGEGYASHPDRDQQTTLMLVDLPQGGYAGKSVTIGL